MDRIARNALRLSLAGAGVAVLGAGFVGQASAAELPTDQLGGATDPTAAAGAVSGAVADATGNDVSVLGQNALPTAVPTAATPSTDQLPAVQDAAGSLPLPADAAGLAGLANAQAPGLS